MKPCLRWIILPLFAPMLALSVSADVVRRVDETSINGMVTAIRDGKLVIVDSAKNTETSIPLSDLDEVTFNATIPATQSTAVAAPFSPPTVAQAFQKKFPGLATPAPAPADKPPTTQSNDSRVWHLKLAGVGQINVKLSAWSAGKLSGKIARGGVSGSESETIEIPVDAVQEAWCGSADQIRQAKALNEKAGSEDIAFAAREQQVLAVRGIAKGMTADALQFKFGEADRNINLNRLVGIVFAKSAGEASRSTETRQVVTLSSGDTLVGRWTATDDTTISFETSWGQTLHFSRKDVARVRSENGRVVSLSNLTPSTVEETPYFDRVLHYQIDHALNGKPLLLSDGTAVHGIAMHARCVLTYTLDGEFAEFRSKVGFQQPDGRLGNAIVRVKGDGDTLFERVDARGDEPAFDVLVKTKGIKNLTLEVDFGSEQDVGDQVIWSNARLVRSIQP